MSGNFNEKLAEDYEEISERVRKGMLPLVARNPAIDRAVSEYVITYEEYLESKREAGETPPIALRDSRMLERFADLILHEELTWSHPDKMSIVEYPIMSDSQAELREEKFRPTGELSFVERRCGRRRTFYTDADGKEHVSSKYIPQTDDSAILAAIENVDLAQAIERSRLTDRQKQALHLVYFEGLTQTEAAEEMGVGQRTLSYHIESGLNKLRKVLLK